MCLQTTYVLNSDVFLPTRPTHALSLPGRGLALRPERVYTPIKLIFAHFSTLQDMCICMLSVDGPSLENGQFFPREAGKVHGALVVLFPPESANREHHVVDLCEERLGVGHPHVPEA